MILSLLVSAFQRDKVEFELPFSSSHDLLLLDLDGITMIMMGMQVHMHDPFIQIPHRCRHRLIVHRRCCTSSSLVSIKKILTKDEKKEIVMSSHMIEKIDQSWKTEIQLKKDKFWKLR